MRDALAGAESASSPLTFAAALISEASEELYFRCSFPYLWRRPVVGDVMGIAMYTASTLATGNLALVAAAPLLGIACTYAYRRTGRLYAPLIVHGSWSVVMVGIFPALV